MKAHNPILETIEWELILLRNDLIDHVYYGNKLVDFATNTIYRMAQADAPPKQLLLQIVNLELNYFVNDLENDLGNSAIFTLLKKHGFLDLHGKSFPTCRARQLRKRLGQCDNLTPKVIRNFQRSVRGIVATTQHILNKVEATLKLIDTVKSTESVL